MNAPVKYSQKALIYSRVDFTFHDKYLEYRVEDEKVVAGFSIPYEALPLKKSFQTFREKWPVYILMAAIPATLINMVIDAAQKHETLTMQIIIILTYALLIGMIIISRFAKFQADVIETNEGKILIFDRPLHQEITDEIFRRRTAELRRLHLSINRFNDPQAEIQKFRQLKEQNIISEQEYTDAIGKLLAKRDKP